MRLKGRNVTGIDKIPFRGSVAARTSRPNDEEYQMNNSLDSLRVHRLVAATIKNVADALGYKDASGMLIYSGKDGGLFLTAAIGDGSNEKFSDCYEIAGTNAAHLAVIDDEVLSSESRVDEIPTETDERYAEAEDETSGGAVRTPTGRILSFAGLTEEDNEVFMLAIAVTLGWMKHEDATAALTDRSPFDSRAKFNLVYEIVALSSAERAMV